MTDLALRPLRVWATPSYRSKQITTGYYWWWECRICDHVTRDLIPSLSMAYDDAVHHLSWHEEDEDDGV